MVTLSLKYKYSWVFRVAPLRRKLSVKSGNLTATHSVTKVKEKERFLQVVL